MDPYLISLRPAELSVCTAAASFLQTDFWGGFKARFGWTALAFTAEWLTGTAAAGAPAGGPLQSGGGTTVLPLLVLHRRLGPALSFAYVPWGPELPAGYDAAGNTAAARLAAVLRGLLPGDTAFIRFDFPWYCETRPAPAPESVPPPVSSAGRAAGEGSPPGKPFRRAAANVQPPDSVLVNLAPGEPAILGAMKSKWRYNVGLAEKRGVQVRIAGSPLPARQELEAFYGMYRETAARDGIAIHGIAYYEALFEEAAKYGRLPPGCRPDTRLYIASHEGEDIAGIVTLFRGREAVYLYGASANRKRNLMAPYALQWRAMRDAKAAGCVYYDLFGIPPEDPDINPHHPMAGLYRFKTGFIGGGEGGVIIHRPGSWDYPCRFLAWALYSAAERARKKIRDMRKKKPRT